MATSNREENHIFPICHLFATISRVAFGKNIFKFDNLVKTLLENSLIEKNEKFIWVFHRNHKI